MRDAITPETEGGKDLSLLADCVSGGNRLWFGLCLATDRRFLVWRTVQIADEKAATLAAALAREIEPLRSRGFVVCGVVTDNASNQKRALDPRAADSLQRTTKTCVIGILV
jgi:hypothetical protein